jgi:hypothetical protein
VHQAWDVTLPPCSGLFLRGCSFIARPLTRVLFVPRSRVEIIGPLVLRVARSVGTVARTSAALLSAAVLSGLPPLNPIN